MKFSCEKSLLAAAVNTASRAAAAKSAVSSLEGLLIEALDGVTVTGYDLKIGIRSSLPADVGEMGSVVLNCKLFGDIIRKLPDDIVTVTVDNSTFAAEISCGMSRFKIMGMSAGDYPELPDVKSQNYLRIKEKDIREIIGETIFAVSDNEARPIHTGALFEVDGTSLTVVAVDGYRLALRKGTLTENKIIDKSFVVPGSCLNEAERIAGDSDDDVKLTVGMKHIMFTIGRTELISRRLEGEFLNYKNSIPKDSKYSLGVARRDMINAIERVSLIISDKFKSPVRCRFNDGVARVSTQTTLGAAADECPIEGDGEGIEIGFNNRYILEALRAAPADKVVVKLNTSVAPCIIVPESGEDFLYMILPVRMRTNEN